MLNNNNKYILLNDRSLAVIIIHQITKLFLHTIVSSIRTLRNIIIITIATIGTIAATATTIFGHHINYQIIIDNSGSCCFFCFVFFRELNSCLLIKIYSFQRIQYRTDRLVVPQGVVGSGKHYSEVVVNVRMVWIWVYIYGSLRN